MLKYSAIKSYSVHSTDVKNMWNKLLEIDKWLDSLTFDSIDQQKLNFKATSNKFKQKQKQLATKGKRI